MATLFACFIVELAYWASFKEIEMTQSNLDALPEYSCSEPTIGERTKLPVRWKHNVHAFNPAAREHPPAWLLGEFTDGSNLNTYRTTYRRVQVVPVAAWVGERE